jgi:aspartyl protease family protein
MLAWLALVIAALISLLVFMPGDSAGMDRVPGLTVAASVLALLIALYVAASSRSPGNSGRNHPMLLTAAALFTAALAIAAYVLKDNATLSELVARQVTTAATPAGTSSGGPAAVMIRKDQSGRFLVRGAVNAAAVEFLLDTGATTVMLRHSDAEKAGVDMKGLTFNTPVVTANGTAYAAAVRLRSVAVGPVHAGDVEALVVPAGSLNESLLGMSFLRRLGSYDLKGDFLTLRQ